MIRHVRLVAEVANLLIQKFNQMNVDFDEDFVCLGVAFHDAGKIIHPQELVSPENQHEADGEKLLISNGVNIQNNLPNILDSITMRCER